MSHNRADPLRSSFRDPAGYVFRRDGSVHRFVSPQGLSDLDLLHSSGLYDALVAKQYLVAHEIVESQTSDGGRVLLPQQVPYISYPYEWSFSQLKSAALLTLKVQKMAMQHEMSLKDASAYNVQFFGSSARFIDTLSFEPLKPNKPWVAYKQFCEHFLGPLALMAHTDVGLNKLLLANLDGIPLPLVSKILPGSTRLNYSLLVHIHLHARSQQKHADDAAGSAQQPRTSNMTKQMLAALHASLVKAVEKCVLKIERTEWSHYYDDTNYSADAMDHKAQQIDRWLKEHTGANTTVHDVGANTGYFSRIAARHGSTVIAHDIDMMAVERHFSELADARDDHNILPLHLNFSNPSPAIGWGLSERDDVFQRSGSGLILALALVHHLAIGNNTPLAQIAEQFARMGDKLIIEFVPKCDSQVDRLLQSRADIFPNYNQASFEQAFSKHFSLLDTCPVEGSERTLYLYQRS